MNNVVLFLLKSILVSSLFTSWYWLALRNKQLHRYNRFFLLFALYASIQLPLLQFQWFTIPAPSHVSSSRVSSIIYAFSENGREKDSEIANIASFTGTNWKLLLLALAALVSSTLLFILFRKVALVVKMAAKYPRSSMDGISIVHTNLPEAPFSFLNWLFWRETIAIGSEDGKMIFKHETTHIRQRHTYDKLVCQVMTCIFWFNPFYWLIQKEVGMIHEFIADEQAINCRDTDAFARMLLQAHSNGRYLAPEHQFFSSPIKRRLNMLQKASKTNKALLRRMMALPIAAGAILIFSFSPFKEKENVVRANKKIVLVLDPGHGGADNGVQYGTIKEKDVNLKIANRIKELAPGYNIETYLTRSKDETLSLQERVAISNNLHADDFISIHVTDDPERDMMNGNFDIAVCIETPKLELSRQLGRTIYQHLNRVEGSPKPLSAEAEALKLHPKGLYVLSHNTAPGVLIEFGNIKDKEQMQMLTDEARLDAICNAVLKGVADTHKQ